MSEFRHEVEPPAMLEDRVVDALRSRGLLRPARRPLATAFIAAAAIACVVAGYAAGRWHAQNQTATGATDPEFMLLLHDTPLLAQRAIPERQLVEDYGRWAREVYAGGHAIRGEKLKDVPGQTLGGFFIIRAPSFEAAKAIADTCPHARLGGRIDIREIDPT